MVSSVHIVASGARTSLGLQAAPSAAAIRAAVSGMAEHPFIVDFKGNPLVGSLDHCLDPRMNGPDRLLALAEGPLREACAPLNSATPGPLRLPVYLGLPALRPGFTAQDAATVRAGLARLEGLPTKFLEVNVLTDGHAAGFSALAMATEQIRQGVFEVCLFGGVDSYFQPATLGWLDANRQLATPTSRSAFVPGEGAGFCLLMTDRARDQLGMAAQACVRAVALGKETKLIKTPDICLGEGLTATVQNAVSCVHLPGETINDTICDINGERYRSEEWGFVCLRLSRYFDDPTAYLSPADCWGDVGAASGPLYAMLACQAAERGYAKGPRSLLWASSEGGLRGAAVLETSVKL
jgi:3-oxoacyl-[acyl-carrier-protein] synthase-1